MILAGMISTDETALICDLAEEYGVLDWRALPVRTAAALAAGLRENSRIKMKLAGLKVEPKLMMLALIADRLGLLVWAQTKDGQKGRNRPESIVGKLTKEPEEEDKAVAYADGGAFMDAWKALTGQDKGCVENGDGTC